MYPSRAFDDHSDSALRSLGFQPTIPDSAVYRLVSGSSFVIITKNVDNFGVYSNDVTLRDDIYAKLGKIYKLTKSDSINSYLGMHIQRDRAKRAMFVSQDGYALSI